MALVPGTIRDTYLTDAVVSYMQSRRSLAHGVLAPRLTAPLQTREANGPVRVGWLVEDRRNSLGSNGTYTAPEHGLRAPGAPTVELVDVSDTYAYARLQEHREYKLLVDGADGPLSADATFNLQVRRMANVEALKMERQCAALAQAGGTYADATLDIAAAATWISAAGDPNGNVTAVADAMVNFAGVRPNVAFFGRDVTRDALRNFFGGKLQGGGATSAGIVADLQDVAARLGLKAIVPLDATYNSAEAGAALVSANVWDPEDVLLVAYPDELVAQLVAAIANPALPWVLDASGAMVEVPLARIVASDGMAEPISVYLDEQYDTIRKGRRLFVERQDVYATVANARIARIRDCAA